MVTTICDHPPRLSPFVGKLNFALQVKIRYNSLWLPMVLDKLWKIITCLLDMLQSWLNCHLLGLDVSISNILQPQNTPWATKGLIGGGGPHISSTHWCYRKEDAWIKECLFILCTLYLFNTQILGEGYMGSFDSIVKVRLSQSTWYTTSSWLQSIQIIPTGKHSTSQHMYLLPMVAIA